MWLSSNQNKPVFKNINEELAKMEGSLEGKEAKISLAKFLRHNVGFTTELISGIKLAPFQEITLRGLMNNNFNMCVYGRGCGKTFIASVFCFLQCIFEPGTKILIAGPTFRTARFIFGNLEKMVNSRGAEMLHQAFSIKPSKRNDQYEWLVNGGSITAVPLSGEKIRGFRANVLVLDEFLLLPEEIIKTVLMPFLVAPQDIAERIRIRDEENSLIEKGLMKEKDRIVFKNDSKMVALSSASYTFENLYKTYKEWTEKIRNPEKNSESTYFVSQLGYEALPEEMIDKTIIDEAKSGGQSHSSFQREYCAQFTDGSDSYFSAKKMHECTVPDGKEPTTLINGKKGEKYILGIDPSFSNSPSSDFFAMSLMELNDETQQGTLVHSYAVAGGNLKDHIKYLYYILSSFNVEMIIIDNAGAEFIDGANESKLFKEQRLKIDFFDFESWRDGSDHVENIKKAKRQYNKESNTIAFKQVFNSDFIRKANEWLQARIDHKQIWFSSRTTASENAFNRSVNQKVNMSLVNAENILDLLEIQDDLINQTKKQCALVEVSSTSRGTQTFDLPLHLRKSASANRARKDNYTTLMLSNWAIKNYYEIVNFKEEKVTTFTPRMLG